MECNIAPIALFVYNRPSHTLQTLEALAKNDLARESLLYIFADGPKENAGVNEIIKITETRECIRSKQWCKEVIIFERVINFGLAESIITGVTEVVNRHGKVIVLEDDLLLSRFFLLFMNDSLVRYEYNNRVGQIGACNFFACGKKFPSSFFLPIPDCWGWATWKNRWGYFILDSQHLLQKLYSKNLIDKFNVYGSYDMEALLKMQIEGKVNSWAIRWQAVCVINDWLTLYPNPSLTNHIGSKNGTHMNADITPPIIRKRPNFETIQIVEIPEVKNAMKNGYSGKADYYGNAITKTRAIKFLSQVLKMVKGWVFGNN